MTIVDELLKAESKWESSAGGAIPGEGVRLYGHDMFEKFKNWNWLGLYFHSATGRELSENSEKFFNGLYSMCFSYPDSRIWNNGVAALAGTVRSTGQLAVCAASAVSEAEFYGGPPVMKSLDFFIRAKANFDLGMTFSEIEMSEKINHKFIFGYGRPVVSKDERVKPALALLEELDLYERPYVQFALQMENHLQEHNEDLGLNIGGVFAAFCADEGISPNELYYMMVVCFSAGMIACYKDALGKKEGYFFPTQCEAIEYSGERIRAW